jgi:hypothetical protein
LSPSSSVSIVYLLNEVLDLALRATPKDRDPMRAERRKAFMVKADFAQQNKRRMTKPEHRTSPVYLYWRAA